MGHPVLAQVAQPVADVREPAVAMLLEDMFDTMAACSGAGLAAPQIGVSVRVVVFGVTHNPRYPQAEAVPRTVLLTLGRLPKALDLAREDDQQYGAAVDIILEARVTNVGRVRKAQQGAHLA